MSMIVRVTLTLSALVLAALCTLLFVTSSAQATFPGANGKIAFVGTDPTNPGNRDVFTMDPDGIDVTNLTAGSGALDILPDWSRDARRIAFASSRDRNLEIYAIDADGSNPTRLTNSPATDLDPSWAPSGKQIVFASNRDGDFELYLMNADSSNVRQLTNNAADDRQPQFSPSGNMIVFVSDRSGTPAIWVMSADGISARQLTADTLGAVNPSWSPDGKRIAFTDNCCVAENSHILVMNANGKSLRQLTQDFGNNQRPDWSPDGQKIVFDHGTIDFATGLSSTLDLYEMNSDGTGVTQLTNTPTISELAADWASG
jgi:tol-pal system beta propeller repeat protein TolB